MSVKIIRDEANQDIYKQLAESPKALFPQIRDLFVFAVCTGYERGSRREIEKPSKDFTIVDHSILEAMMMIIASETEQEGYEGEDDIKIISEYINAGIEIIASEILNKGGSQADRLMNFILES